MPSRNDKIFYGWYIVIAAFLANFTAVGITFYIMNAFMEPLTKINGWSRTDVNMALVYGALAYSLSQLLWGTVVMRTGPRFLMALAPFFTGLCFMRLGYVDRLFQFYFYYVLINIGSGAFGGIVAGTAVNNWFVQKRGNAMGMATAGISLSGAVFPLVTMLLIIYVDVKGAFFWIGLATMLMSPIFWYVVRNWPEDYGLAPDGVIPGYDNRRRMNGGLQKEDSPFFVFRPPEAEGSIWTLKKVLRNGTFWKVGTAFSFIMITVSSVMSQLKPRFSDVGFDDMTAMLLMSATALLGTAGKYVWGAFCDRFDSRRVVAVLTSLLVVGLLFALLPVNPVTVFLFIVIFGFSMGGAMSTLPIVVADLFGRESFPAVFRLISLFLMLELAGFVIAGQSYDRTGSYNLAYLIYVFLDAAAVTLILTAKRPVLNEGS